MRPGKYTNQILEIIKRGRSVPHWSISDYLTPIRQLYSKLSPTLRKEFRLSLLELLKGKDYLDNLLDVCETIQLEDACPALVRLFMHPPKYSEGYPIWIDGFRRRVVAALGKLRCRTAKPLLIRLLRVMTTSKTDPNLPRLDLESYGVVLYALIEIAPEEAAEYFGWWIEKAQQVGRRLTKLVQQAEGWQELKAAGINLPMDEKDSPSIQFCLLAVARKEKLGGLREWLKSVTLMKNGDRDYLKYQLVHMLTGKDPLSNLRTVVRVTGDPQVLAEELASLPSVKKESRIK